jgi:hypothetical protein
MRLFKNINTIQRSILKDEIMKKTIFSVVDLVLLFMAILSLGSCIKNDTALSAVDKQGPDVAIAWVKMQQKLFVGTPGLLPHVTARAYGYAGLTLYESLVPGMKDYQSIASQLNGELKLPAMERGKKYHWPATANAALSNILRQLLPHTTPGLLRSVDSLEATLHLNYHAEADSETLNRSAEFGNEIADAIFEWSKTDGAHEAYKTPFSDDYVSPTGPGKWVPTGEFPFSEAVYPYWGNCRSFIPNIVDATQPPPHPSYSEEAGSVFYNAANEIYTMSQNLSRADSLTAKFWAYELLNPDELAVFEDASHAANIATQIVELKGISLQDAAVLYCKHGIAQNDAVISSVRTKFHYNLLRPITYIRRVLGHGDWKPVVHTPPFPEYTSAHAVISMACADVLENTFGEHFSFTDHSFDNTYGPRTFDSFDEYAKEAALSRLQAGIHYRFSMDEGLKQGAKVGEMVNRIKFRK